MLECACVFVCMFAAAAIQQNHMDKDHFPESTKTVLRLLYSTSFQVGLTSWLPVTLSFKLTANATGDENVLDPGDEPLLLPLLLETGNILTCQQTTHPGTSEIL